MSEAFARVPLWLLGRSDVSWAAKVLYGLLARYVGRGRSAWPSVDTIAADMRTSRRNVERWIGELRAAGLVDVERTGRANTYRLLGAEPQPAPDDGSISVPEASPLADQIRQPERIRSAAHDGSDPPSLADQIRQDCRIDDAPTSYSEEIKEKITEESASTRPCVSSIGDAERAMRQARAALLRGYQQRYEAATGEPWMGHGRAASDIDTCSRVVLARGVERIDDRASTMLDHVFTDEWMTRNRWPWAAIAKDPARYLAPPPPPAARRGEGYVKLQAMPGEFGGGDFGDEDIPAADDGPQKVIGYGT